MVSVTWALSSPRAARAREAELVHLPALPKGDEPA
jgi:hypothetical protein